MSILNTFSLSLQKQVGTERIIDDRELNQAFTALRFNGPQQQHRQKAGTRNTHAAVCFHPDAFSLKKP